MTHSAAELDAFAAAVTDGQLVIIPTDTSYAVITDAFNGEAVARLRAARNMDDIVPLPVATGTIETAHGVARLSGLALDLASNLWPGPLTMLVPAQTSLSWKIGPADAALAIRVPAHPIAMAILGRTGPVVMTGAHIVGGEPSRTLAQACETLGDAVAVDGGELPGGYSSVVDATTPNLRLIREGALTLEQLRNVVPMIVKGA